MIIPSALKNRSVFAIKLSTIFETMRALAPISTIIRQTAKTVDLPNLTVDDAKNHSIACQNTVGVATPSNETVTIDTKSDKSIDYCNEDFRDDKVGFKRKTQSKIGKVITRKVNQNMADAMLAGATAQVGTIDLSTNTLVGDFLTSVSVDAAGEYFEWAPSVEGGTVVEAKYQGQGFVLAGSTAYKHLKRTNNTIRFQSTTDATSGESNLFISLEGVVVVNAGPMFTDPKQLVYGIAGVPVHAYRTDKIVTWDDEIRSRTTASADSGDVSTGDAMYQRNHNMGAEIWNKALIPTALASHLKKQVMA